ncbi:MAG: iron-containing alcohol dehydrogenase [Verrucomicrobiota bacterium]|nr:iron-containing alcohol dehydrogenase [Verrucomicrobiota bacterium]
MVIPFEFATAARILFGCGKLRTLPDLCATFGSSLLLVTGKNKERHQETITALKTNGYAVSHFVVEREPTVELVLNGARVAGETKVHLVVALGGGSVIDAGKAIAALATNNFDFYRHAELVGKGEPLKTAPLPLIAIPTTAGTGAEVTRNAVIGVPDQRLKVSLRSPLMLPRIALIDPELTFSLPPEITASTGMDALTQLIEPFVSERANPVTDALCRNGIQKAAAALPRACCEEDRGAREEMSLASLFGGMALANAGLGAVHGFAAPIGGMYPGMAHGTICAALLPAVMEINIRELQRQQRSDLLERFAEVTQLLTSMKEKSPEAGVAWLRNLTKCLKIPTLKALGVREQDFETICSRAMQASSMKANPVRLGPEQLKEILERAY